MLSKDTLDFLKEQIELAAIKHDRSVSLYFTPDGGGSIAIYPWPDGEDLYQMYQDGKITFNDYRTKMGLPEIKEGAFLKSKTQFNIQFKEEK